MAHAIRLKQDSIAKNVQTQGQSPALCPCAKIEKKSG